MFDIHVALMMD